MKIALLLALPAFALVLALGGCGKSDSAPDSAILFQTIHDNVSALEKKDVDAVMATIHPDAPAFDSTKDIIKQMFAVLDVKYTVSDLKVVTASPDEAQVSFVQKMEKTGGEGQFQNNIVEGIHTLRPDHGKWKIYRTLNEKVTGLDGKPLTPPSGAETPPAEAAPSPASATEPAPKPATPAEKPTPQ